MLKITLKTDSDSDNDIIYPFLIPNYTMLYNFKGAL